jgi:hypothetical protein
MKCHQRWTATWTTWKRDLLLFIREKLADTTAKDLQLRNVRRPNQHFVLTKLVL